MIEMPRRSITRFFIPMIDVLTLLFCIYLLLPIAKDPDAPEDLAELAARLKSEIEPSRGDPNEQLLLRLREELARLQKMNTETLQQRLAVRILEVDGRTGQLFYRDPDPVEIAGLADARRLIARDRERHGSSKELYYLILSPRDRTSGYPTREDRRNFALWFEGVALGYDEPGSGPPQRKQP
jgi:hypothetical protein